MSKSHKKNNHFYFTNRLKVAMTELQDYPMAIIEAPMGYGKTTSTRELLKGKDANIYWLRAIDSHLGNLWEGMCQLLSAVDQDRSQALKEMGFPTDQLMINATLGILEQIQFEANTILVIDDYHLVECDSLNYFLEIILLSETLDVCIVLNTRYTYFKRLEELKLKGYIYHVEKNSFELNVTDIIQYYRLCGINLSVEEGNRLYAVTEGWISALYLLQQNYEPSVEMLPVNDIYALIKQVVYQPLSQSCQEFLVAMCIFDGFTLEQAAFVWPSSNTHHFIQDLMDKNAFIEYDFYKKTYYFHSMLRQFLLEILLSYPDIQQSKIYHQGALWFEQKKSSLLAMEYAYKAGDFNCLMRVLEEDKGRSTSGETKQQIIHYYQECPFEIKSKYPYAMLVYIRRMFTFNEIELFRSGVGDFLKAMQVNPPSTQEESNRLFGEFQLAMSFTGYNDINKMAEFHQKALHLMKEPSTILDRTASWTFGSPSVLYMFYRESGKLAEEVDTIEKAMPAYYQLTRNHGMGAEIVMKGEAMLLVGDVDEAEILAHSGLRVAEIEKQSGIVVASRFLLVRIALFKGNYQGAIDILKKLREEVASNQWYIFIHTIELCETFIESLVNHDLIVPTWIKTGAFNQSKLFFPTYGFFNIVYGRTLLVQGEYSQLLGLREHFLKISSVFPNVLAQIYTYIFMASANMKLFRDKDAQADLDKALELALPDKALLPFVENGDYLKGLLASQKINPLYSHELKRINELIKNQESNIKSIRKVYFSKEKAMLTQREKEIATLAADGLSNKEIGEILNISPNTVKTQLKSIFEKLNINSRVLLGQYIQG